MKKILILLSIFSSVAFSQWTSINSGISIPFDNTTFSFIQHGANSSLLLQSYETNHTSPILYRSTNNGDQWLLLSSTISTSYNCYLEYNGRLFAGRNGGNGVVYSTDNGQTWNNATGFPAVVNILDIEVIGSTLFAVNILGGVFVSTDNGNTWQSKNSSSARKLAKIGSTLYVGISGGVIKTTDLGSTWTTVNNGLTGIILQTDQLVASNSALIAFTGGNIFRSTDGGDSWTSQTLPVGIAGTTGFSSLYAEGSNVIVLNAQTIIISTDAGATWVNSNGDFPTFPYFNWQNVKALSAIISGSYAICGTGLIAYNPSILGAGVYRRSISGATDIDENTLSQPTDFQLLQNYPNPFNPTTKIHFEISGPDFVTLKVFDVIGREVAVLVNEYKPAGIYNINFDASELSSGIYFYKLQAGNFSSTKKMVLTR